MEEEVVNKKTEEGKKKNMIIGRSALREPVRKTFKKQRNSSNTNLNPAIYFRSIKKNINNTPIHCPQFKGCTVVPAILPLNIPLTFQPVLSLQNKNVTTPVCRPETYQQI